MGRNMKNSYNKVKGLFVTIAFMFVFFPHLQLAQWNVVHTPPNLGAIYMVNETVGYATGNSRVVKTTDGGKTWLTIHNLNNHFGLDIGFIDQNTGLIAGTTSLNTFGIMYYTSNGGSQWTQVAATNKQFSKLFILNSQTAFAVDLNGNIYKTANGIQNWLWSSTIQNFEPWSIFFINSNVGWVVGKNGKVFKSFDGGVTWTDKSIGGTHFLKDVFFVNENVGYIISYNSRLFKTIDGGESWTESPINAQNLSRIQFTNEDVGYISALRYVLQTTNGGLTWGFKYLAELGSLHYNGMHFFNENLGYFIGNKGIVYKTSDAFLTVQTNLIGEAQHLRSVGLLSQQVIVSVGDAGTILKTTNGGTSWFSAPGYTDKNLNHIQILNEARSIVVGDSGTILRSLNLNEWLPLTVPTSFNLNSVHFLNNSLGFVVGDNGIILRTTNAGNTWQIQHSGTNVKLRSVFFANETLGFAAGDNGAILKTTDLGVDWQLIHTGIQRTIYQIQFPAAIRGYAISTLGLILRSTDYGETWSYHWSWLPNGNNISMHFSSTASGKFLTDNNGYFATTTGGESFTWFWMFSPNTYSKLNALSFLTNNFGFMVADNGYIMKVTSGSVPIPVELVSFSVHQEDGKAILKWETASELNNHGFEIQRRYNEENDSSFSTIGFKPGKGTTTEPQFYEFIDEIPAYINGSISYRLKQIDFDGQFEYSEVVTIDNPAGSSYALYQNYPNPFNPGTVISWQSPVSGMVTLKVYDILGNKIATLVNEEKQPGVYEVEFNINSDAGRKLSSGIYFYQLKVRGSETSSGQGFIETKKMVLIK